MRLLPSSSREGFRLEEKIAAALSSKRIPFLREENIRKFYGRDFNGVDFVIFGRESVFFVQCKYKNKPSTQKEATQFKDCTRRLISSNKPGLILSSLKENKKIIPVWLGRLPPTRNALSSLTEMDGFELISSPGGCEEMILSFFSFFPEEFSRQSERWYEERPGSPVFIQTPFSK